MRTLAAITILVTTFVLLLLPQAIFATAGDLDSTFDFDGMKTIHFPYGDAQAYAVAIQPDGKIVVCGDAFNSTDHDFVIVRMNTDGSYDSNFGSNGVVAANFGGEDYCKGVAVQQDGKIVAAGTAQVNSADFALVRYNSDGSPDFSFGSNGRVTTDFVGMYDFAQAMLIQQDGKIVVAGVANHDGRSDFALARYNTNGSLDSSFDGDGKVITILGSQYSEADGLVQQLDGKIIAVGFATTNASSDFALVRYNTNGSLDSTFDNDGKVTTDFGTNSALLNSVALQPDGKIVAGGSVYWSGTYDFVLARYNTNGSLDQNFGFGGVIITPVGPLNDTIFAVLLQSDGKIIAAGSAYLSNVGQAFALIRFNNDGSIDNSFGSSGKVFTNWSAYDDVAFDALLQPDGKIVAVGVAGTSLSPQDFAIARYTRGDLCDCTYVEYFDGSTLPHDWSYSQPYWFADNGNLNGTSTRKKTDAIAVPAFDGCELCSVETSMSTDGGEGNKISLLAWYVDPQNYVEVMMNEGNDKWIIKQRYGGRVVAKANARSAITPGVFYTVKINFDGTNFTLEVNGAIISTMRAVAAPQGTVGFRVKNTTGRFAFIAVS